MSAVLESLSRCSDLDEFIFNFMYFFNLNISLGGRIPLLSFHFFDVLKNNIMVICIKYTAEIYELCSLF
jgi:hypothetical protein